ncbi:MAG: hypothetical protein HY678_06265, partial [Chloroflexi bacterium]|nr:hypothetical protein [Chloroflexota bacterium]
MGPEAVEGKAIILPGGMGTSRAKAIDHAYQVLERPRAHMRVQLRQTRGGVSLLYDGRLLTKVYINRSGMRAAMAIAHALGLRVPKLGETLETVASSGMLYRVIALSQIDYAKEEALELARHLLDEADALRSEQE